jgi:hypothetical protein
MTGGFKWLVVLMTLGLAGCASLPSPPAEPNALLCKAYQQRTVELHKATKNAYFNHYGYSLDRRGAEIHLLIIETITTKLHDYQPKKDTLVLRDAQVSYEQALKLAQGEGCSTAAFAPSPLQAMRDSLIGIDGMIADLDQRIVGTWRGMRGQDTSCQFLAWQSTFHPDARYEIVFYSDDEMTRQIRVQNGFWKAMNGQSRLIPKGVKVPDVYDYRLIDGDTIEYVNVSRGPTAECQEDYRFVERRVRD